MRAPNEKIRFVVVPGYPETRPRNGSGIARRLPHLGRLKKT